MISKKICMVGAFAVGKTSLVRQYVHSCFSDRYLATIGTKISKKECLLDDGSVSLVLWDMEGEGEYSVINTTYLRGAMGFFVVADGTRGETVETAMVLRELAFNVVGEVPHFLLLNKADLREQWEVTEEDIAYIETQGVQVLQTSAKIGSGVEDAFTKLTRALL